MKIPVSYPDCCTYCDGEVFKDDYGWGWLIVGNYTLLFHTECVEIEFEPVII